MPVHKYRSIEDMPRPPRSADAQLVGHIRALWNRAFLLAPPTVVHGVTRFRTIEDANELRRVATLEKMRATRRKASEQLP